jgi:hypothetical protein
MPGATFSNPLPGAVLGDPFVLPWRGRFYLFGTNDGPPLSDGRAIPVLRSEDLIHWEPLGGALVPAEQGADHWAPEVMAWNGKFYMVVSFGDVERVGHALWVAVAERPEGPYRLEKRMSEPSEAFSIDGAWLLDDDGRLYLYRCLDFVEEAAPPHGTGIVVQPMRDPLTPGGPARTVLRAHAPWHLFEASRVMPSTRGGPSPSGRRSKGRPPSGARGGSSAATAAAIIGSPTAPARPSPTTRSAPTATRAAPLGRCSPPRRAWSTAQGTSRSSDLTSFTTGSCSTADAPARPAAASGSAPPAGTGTASRSAP